MRESNAVTQEEEPLWRGRPLTIKKAVCETGIGKDWFYRHMDNGTLPFPWYLLGPGLRKMDSADIKDWLDAQKIPAGRLPGEI